MDKSKPIEFSKDGKEWREITDVDFNGNFIHMDGHYYPYDYVGRVWKLKELFGYIRNKRSHKQGRCHTCKHFDEKVPVDTLGECHNEKLNSSAACDEDELFAGTYGYDEYVIVGVEFGCIHWEAIEHNIEWEEQLKKGDEI